MTLLYLNRADHYRRDRRLLFLSQEYHCLLVEMDNTVGICSRHQEPPLWSDTSHEIRALATSWAVRSNSSVGEIVQACAWTANTTFASFCLRSDSPGSEDDHAGTPCGSTVCGHLVYQGEDGEGGMTAAAKPQLRPWMMVSGEVRPLARGTPEYKSTQDDEIADSPVRDRNPSPPPELRQNKDLDLADKVGQTAFSKHWIFSTLMKLIQEVDREDEKTEGDQPELGVDISEHLQNELCELWDMSMNPDVAEFLNEFKAMDVLGGVVNKSKAPRVVEICIGILGNMACNGNVCTVLSDNSKLVSLILQLLESRDPPTLTETTRLMYICLCNRDVSSIWISAIKGHEETKESLKFILQSSTNVELLKKAGEFLDKLLELDDDLCKDWATQEMVQALLEAVHQIGYSHSEALEVYLHIFELLSTTEEGMEALLADWEQVHVALKKYLSHVCEYEIVSLQGHEACLASALAVLNVLFSSSPEVTTSIIQDEQSIRCLLKILEPLYTRIQQFKDSTPPASTGINNHTSEQLEERGPESALNNNHPEGDTCNTGLDHGKVEPSDSVGAPVKNKVDTNCTNVGHDNESKIGQGDSAGSYKAETVEEKEANHKYLHLLYEIVQGFLVDMVNALYTAMPKQVAGEGEMTVPVVLKYVDTRCTRDRVRCMICTLEEITERSEDADPIVRLSDLAQRFQLRRLCDIIDNVPFKQTSCEGKAVS